MMRPRSLRQGSSGDNNKPFDDEDVGLHDFEREGGGGVEQIGWSAGLVQSVPSFVLLAFVDCDYRDDNFRPYAGTVKA